MTATSPLALMPDHVPQNVYQASGPWTQFFNVTLDDSNDLTYPCRGFRVGTGGNVKVTLLDDTTVTIPSLLAGEYFPAWVKRIWSTGTTASGLTAGR